MGTVYKAHDRVLAEPVAIKLLRSEVASDAEMTRRFRSEIKLARKVSHRNVCRIHEYGEDKGLRYISMEFIDGVDLKQVLRQRGGLPPQEAFDISVQLALGLEAIHDVGIIHRDLKTPNIMRDSRGVVRLMDFGIAKLSGADATSGGTATGQVMGTPEYMSPEQARGQKVDFRTDIYALGVVIYEIFTGQVPFKGDTPVATLFMHVQEPPPLTGFRAARIPAPLVGVLARALQKHPSDRYGSVKEMAEALRQAWAASGSEAVALATPTGLPVLRLPEENGVGSGASPISTEVRGGAPTVGLAATPGPPPRGSAPRRPAAARDVPGHPAPTVLQRAGGPTPQPGLDQTRKGLLLGALVVAVGAGVSLSLWDDLFPSPAVTPETRPPLTLAGAVVPAYQAPSASASAAADPSPGDPGAPDQGTRRAAASPPPVTSVPAPSPRVASTARAPAAPRPTPTLAAVPPTTVPPPPPPAPTPTPPPTTLAPTPLPAPAIVAPTTLAPAAVEQGVLQLVVVPFADVTVDDAPAGKVSSSKLPLATGSHVVVLNHPDYQPLRRKISIVPGETLKLVVDLAEEALRKKK